MNRSSNHRGMTLIEIMIAILILSVGLLGVLAAVPFGAMQMGKMVEKDFVTSTAINAHNIIAVNGWNQPIFDSGRGEKGYWCATKNTGAVPLQYALRDFTLPVLLDPLGYADFPFDYTNMSLGAKVIDLDLNLVNSRGEDSTFNFIFPGVELGTSGTDYNNYNIKLDRLFRSADDIVYERDDNSTNRPIVLKETDESGQTIVSYTGEYSWMAMMAPSAAGVGNDFTNLRFPVDDPNVTVDVKTDVVVFRGRVPGDATDYIVAKATVQGSGYAGGVVLLEKTSDVSTADAPAYAAALVENLQSSTHLLLIGPSDLGDQYTARWYKIANFSESDLANGIPVTLIGDNCPVCWAKSASRDDVRAVVFKNVRGVSTKTTRLSAQ